MSVRVMSWVWESSRSEGLDRLVLLAVADSAKDHGGDAWPSMRTLTAKAKVSERTVQRALRRLVELGELSIAANAGQNGVNVYRVVMTPRHVDTPTPVTLTPVSTTPRQPDAPSESRVPPVTLTPTPRHSDTQTVLEPSKNRPTPSAKAISSNDPRFVEFWSVYPKRVSRGDALKAFAKAIVKAPAEDIIKGAQKYRDDPNRSPQYTAHPATWLNGERWADESGAASSKSRTRPAGWEFGMGG